LHQIAFNCFRSQKRLDKFVSALYNRREVHQSTSSSHYYWRPRAENKDYDFISTFGHKFSAKM
jgi:hypothetical protein